MTRRYLSNDEVDAVLRRGKSAECFLGPCEQAGRPGVRYLSMRLTDGLFVAAMFETQDIGSLEALDLYEFGPLNDELEIGEPDRIVDFASLDECLAFLDQNWPGSGKRLVNEGVIQNEYADYLADRSN